MRNVEAGHSSIAAGCKTMDTTGLYKVTVNYSFAFIFSTKIFGIDFLSKTFSFRKLKGNFIFLPQFLLRGCCKKLKL